MFKKILIANRGEIACRVMRTAKRMGIATVAVYSDPDADALHVRMADEAVAIGGNSSAESYLQIDKILAACAKTGADAVHPGYGFLSEKAPFAEALAKAGVTFIGPPVGAIAAMGDKIESKKLAQKAGVSTVPGYLGELNDDAEAIRIAGEIGYPVMLKASAGGGGKGMRIARKAEDVAEGLKSAKAEAKSSFADDRVFLEKYIERPRHIEIQVLADTHGNAIYLGERECSLQRRHQKVIEEAPSPFLDPEMRKAMGEQAVALAKAVGYASAGTVEFIVSPDRGFYFLEMNTRLQVEHPVTEWVTGLDLVEWMIRIAAGEKLTLAQGDVKLEGWSIEARLYAEDPARNFLPAIGRLKRYRMPTGRNVRVDTGVYEGAEISIHYDPMIAKLITRGKTRNEAIAEMRLALDRTEITGLNHNVEFLSALVADPRFASGDISTDLIGETFPAGFAAKAPPEEGGLEQLMAVAAARHVVAAERDLAIADGRHPAPHVPTDWVVRVDGENYVTDVETTKDGARVSFGDVTVELAGDLSPTRTVFEGTIDGRAAAVRISGKGRAIRLARGGQAVTVAVLTPRAAELMALMPIKQAADMSRFLLSPMPGLLVSVAVAEGQEVKAGEPLAVVEAMKMENVLRAERDGTVKRIAASAGASLAVDEVILEFA